MSDVSPSLHDEVVLRARNRCEYCQLSQLGQEAAFHIDHVIPRAAAGRPWPAISPWPASHVPCGSGRIRRPRTLSPGRKWAEHFRWEGERVAPLTPTGRATVAALAMNRPMILAIRQEEAARG